MSAESGPPLDVRAVVAALQRHGVAFVAVGGMAAVWHGAQRATNDFDLCPAWDPQNLELLARALEELDARLLVPDGPPEGIDVPIDGRFLAAMELSTWRTAAGDVDVVLGIPRDRRWNLARFEYLQRGGTRAQLEGAGVTLASLEDIVRSKEVSDRPSDHDALPELRALLRKQARRAPVRTDRTCGPPDHRRKPPKAGM
ncbi:MAG: hypothetical protein ACR2JH_05315 [Solirubrobacteraceae bacterium]